MSDFLISLATVFSAEVGDKSQLMVIAMAAVVRRRQIIAGVAVSAALTQTLSVAMGAWLGGAFPEQAVLIAGGLAFIAFGVWAAVERDSDDPTDRGDAGTGVFAVAVTVFVAELGDKTMLATATLAATSNPVAVWLGSFLALVAAAGFALIAGSLLLQRIPQDRLRRLTATLFVVVGVVLVVNGVR